MANNDLSLFLGSMGFIIKDQRKGLSKNRRGFFKADPMLLKIACRFVGIAAWAAKQLIEVRAASLMRGERVPLVPLWDYGR